MNAPASQIRGEFAEWFEKIVGEKPEQYAERKRVEGEAAKNARAEVDRKFTDEILSGNTILEVKSWRDKERLKSDPRGGRGLSLARYLSVVYQAAADNVTPIDMAKRLGEKKLAQELESWRDSAQRKALAAGIGSAGGTLVPETLAADMIELLRSETVMRKAGVTQIDMPNGNLRFGRQASAASAYWGSENRAITASQPTTDELNFNSKKLTGLVPVSNDLLRVQSVAADQLVRNDIAVVCALAEDLAYLRGDGTAGSPKGVKYSVVSGNSFARTQAGASSTTAEIQNDLMKAIRKLEENNVKVKSGFWVMNATTKNGLMGIRDTIANLVFAPEMRNGTLMGFPFHVTNQIPNNLGGGDEGEVYFIEASEAIIADHFALSIEVFPNGTYVDSNSTMVSGISSDQTVVRAISLQDFGLRHKESASIITTVDWPY